MTVRYTGFTYAGGVLVLDTWTGRVVRVPADGSAPRVLLAASSAAPEASDVRVPEIPAAAIAATSIAAPVAARDADPGWEASGRELTALDREVVSSFPYPVAKTWRAFLSESDPRQRCKLLVDSFSSVLKLWALQVASEYLEAEGVRDAEVNRSLERDFARPLISSWNLMLFRALPVLKEAGIAPFAPELPRAYRELETKCKDRVVVQVHYEDASGARRTKRSKLGKIQALIRYRNGLAHGYNQSRDKAEKDLETYLPVLRDVLGAARFMARYPLFYAARRSSSGLRAHRLMGASPSGEPVDLDVDLDPQRSPLFLFDEARGVALPLNVFLDVDPAEADQEAAPGLGRDVLLFEGNTRSTVIYVSVGGAHVEKQSRIAPWRELLSAKAVDLQLLTKGNLTLEALRKAAQRQTGAALERLVSAGKYVAETTIDRADIDDVVTRFDRSDDRGLVLGGHGGMGKTTILARLVERKSDAGDVVLFYRGSSLADPELGPRILRDLGVRGMFFEDFLAAADACFANGACLRVLVDAVDEHPSDAAGLVRAIDALVRQAESYPWLRVIASVREAAYERLPIDARFGRAEGARYLRVERQRGEAIELSPIVDVGGFTLGELAEVYERYRAYRRRDPQAEEDDGVFVFRPTTAFDELDPGDSTCALIQTPLMMRLVMAAFHRRELPSQISFDDAMRLYVDHVVVEREGERPYPERLRFLMALVRQLDVLGADAIPRDRLYEVDHLRAALQNAQKDSPYVQLLDLGVLMEDWDEDECRVRFAFDGLLEYLLAELHDSRIEEAPELLRATRRALEYKSLRKALVIIVRRALGQRRLELATRALELCQEDDTGELLVTLVRAVVTELGRFSDPSFAVSVDGLRDRPCPASARMLVGAFDDLFALGVTERAMHVVDAAVSIVGELDRPGLAAAAHLRVGLLEQRRGRNAEALETFARSRALAHEAEEPLLVARIDLRRAQILMDQGELEESRALADAAYAHFDAAEAIADAAEARRVQSIIAMRAEDRELWIRYLEDAIELSERAGDRSQVMKALNNLAMARAEDGAHADAEKAYLRAGRICVELGDYASRGAVQLNLATLYSGGLQQMDRSREALADAIGCFEATEHHLGTALALNHLGTLHLLSDELDEAERCFVGALEHYLAREEPLRIAYALWFLGTVAAERGDRDAAEGHYARLQKIAMGLDASQPRVHARALALRVATLGEDVELATAAMDALDEVVVAVGSVAGWDLEDSPATTYLAAAIFFEATNAKERAIRAATRADELAGQRVFHRREELDAVVTRLGIRPAVNVGMVGES